MKKHDVLEYLDLSGDSAERRLISSSRSQRMHSQSTCDCYCKIGDTARRQKKEISVIKKYEGHVKSSFIKSSKLDSDRGRGKLQLTPAKTIQDEQMDAKSSVNLFPISPVLSPETSAIVEDIERLVKDAEIRIKEISLTTNSEIFQKNLNLYPDEASLDDENDQLLYIRERVACKFQEANGCVVSLESCSRNRQFPNEEFVSKKAKRLVDLSAPKFKASEDRYKEFSKQRQLELRNLGFSSSKVNDEPKDDRKKKNSMERIHSRIWDIEKSRKLDTCSVQIGPSLNIKGKFTVQCLEDIHIPPDSTFSQETRNVATYVVSRDFKKPHASPRRREKFVKILDDSEIRSVNGKLEKKVSLTSSRLKDDLIDSNYVLEKSENLEEQNAKNENSTEIDNLNDSNDFQNNLKMTEGEDMESRHSSKAIDDSGKIMEDPEDNFQINIVHKCEQKQVRFHNASSEVENRQIMAAGDKETSATNVEHSLKVPTLFNDPRNQSEPCKLGSSSSVKNDIIKNENNLGFSRDFEGKRGDKDIYEKKRKDKEMHCKMIDERFANIVETYCNQDSAPLEIDNTCPTSSSDPNSVEDCMESLYNLYEPSINQLDNVLHAYNKIIDNVDRSTTTIDEFLSRPEIGELCKENRKSKVDKRRGDDVKTTCMSKRKDSILKNRLPVPEKSCNLKDKEFPIRKAVSLKESTSKKEDKTFGRKYVFPNVKTTNRDECRWKFSTGNNSKEERKIGEKDERQIRFSKECFVRSENDNSTMTTSSAFPLSSSSETKSFNDTKIPINLSELELKNTGCSNRTRQMVPKMKDVEGLIERLLREETQFIEDKMKSVFKVDEIVPLIVTGLLENLEKKGLNFGTKELEILINEDGASNDVTSAKGEIKETDRTETLQRLSKEYDKSGHEDVIDRLSSGHDCEEQSLDKKDETRSNDELPSAKETDSIPSLIKQDDENIISLVSKDSDQQNLKSSGKNITVFQERIVKDGEETATSNKIPPNIRKVEGLVVLNEKSFIDDTNITSFHGEREGESMEYLSKENGRKIPVSVANNFSHSSSSNSLRDCASLYTSPRNPSRASVNCEELLKNDNRVIQAQEMEEINNGGAINTNDASFDPTFVKDKILVDVYDEVRRKFFSSTFDTNHANVLDERFSRPSTAVSTISTGRSNKTEVSSEASHSEGEIYLPSSGSHSLGEVRLPIQGRSDDSENTMTMFVTKEMVASWNESSKSLVQSMGEI